MIGSMATRLLRGRAITLFGGERESKELSPSALEKATLGLKLPHMLAGPQQTRQTLTEKKKSSAN